MEPKVGDIINNKYELIRELGSGSMGVVFLAIHQLLRARVAIKFINSELVQNKEARRRFLLEAQIGAEIKHPGVVSVSDIEANGYIFIVMEYLEGRGLDKIINEKGCIVEIEFAIDVTIQILRALLVVHEKGIIHRDLKPENIFITEGGEVKIMDFGIAKARSAALATTHELTSVGTINGTPHYMSPEQCCGSKSINHQTDIWSVGIMLYEMLTGCFPYIGDTSSDIINRILDGGTNPPKALNPTISEGLERVILKAMEPVPQKRYQSAKEFLVDLESLEEHPAYTPPPPTPTTTVHEAETVIVQKVDDSEPKKKHWRLPVTIAIAVLIIGAFTGWFISQPQPSTEPQVTDPTPTKVVESTPVAQAQAEPEPPAPPEKATPPPEPEPQPSAEATAEPTKRAPPPRPAKQATPEPRRPHPTVEEEPPPIIVVPQRPPTPPPIIVLSQRR